MTPSGAVARLKDHPDLREQVKQAILDRAPADAIAGGKPVLAAAIDSLLDGWIKTAEKQTNTGGSFAYGGQATHALLHDPLYPALKNLDPEHQAFVAGWSMRDVESTVPLDIRQPSGAALTQARGGR